MSLGRFGAIYIYRFYLVYVLGVMAKPLLRIDELTTTYIHSS